MRLKGKAVRTSSVSRKAGEGVSTLVGRIDRSIGMKIERPIVRLSKWLESKIKSTGIKRLQVYVLQLLIKLNSCCLIAC